MADVNFLKLSSGFRNFMANIDFKIITGENKIIHLIPFGKLLLPSKCFLQSLTSDSDKLK